MSFSEFLDRGHRYTPRVECLEEKPAHCEPDRINRSFNLLVTVLPNRCELKVIQPFAQCKSLSILDTKVGIIDMKSTIYYFVLFRLDSIYPPNVNNYLNSII